MSEFAAPMADPLFDYPFGLVEFRLACAAGTVRIFFHGSSSLSPPYRKFGPTTPGNPLTNQWYDFTTATFGTATVGASTVATATLLMVDGALGDDTALDGEIVDMGGPAFLEGGPGVGVPFLPPLGLLLLAAALIVVAALRLRGVRSPRERVS